jgi:hypothetical protein
MTTRGLLALLLAAGSFFSLRSGDAPTGASERKPDFNRDVRPILSDRCFVCHGPDDARRQAELRLDRREDATKTRKHGAAISPGAPDASELVRRIRSGDPDVAMPPPDSGRRPLTEDEREILSRWIASGAPYEPHWAFRPIGSPPVPGAVFPAFERNEIDRFVNKQLKERGLEPSPETSRELLLRRATLDITGLPPSVKELDAFMNDPSADAYEKAVDRLLASPRYGERMASVWLDLARYADTYGYQADVYRAVWPWRDWVIDAFNKNMPYDRFLVEQLAGDLLPNATRQQKLATCFNRLHRQTNEGGSTEEEFRVEYVADRVHTFGTAFLGLTLECARCHDHKFDPLPQEDYYGLFAYFDDIDESGLYSHFTSATPTPTLALPTEAQEASLGALKAELAERTGNIEKLKIARRPAFEEWKKSGNRPALAPPDAYFPLDDIENGKLRNLVDPAKPGVVSDDPVVAAGISGGSLQFSGDNNALFPGVGEFARWQPFSISCWIRTPDRKERAVILKRSRAWTDAGSQGYQLLLEGGRLTWSLVHFWPGNAISIASNREIEPAAWTHVVATYDGSSTAAGLHLYLNGERAEVTVVRDHLWKDITGGDPGPLTLAERFRDLGFKNGRIDELKVYSKCLGAFEARELSGRGGRLGTDDWFEYYIESVDSEVAREKAAIQNVRKALAATEESVQEIMCMEDRDPPRSAFVLTRGRYDAPDRARPVEPHVPRLFAGVKMEGKADRLALARWVVSPDNPLTARVGANRIWSLFFGAGIVKTLENFGSQGATPSNPELLDWLARRWIESGWNLKALIRTIVTSHAYARESRASEAQRRADPENIYLSHGNARRLTAEMLRDQALFSSGLLVERIGGPSVKPWQPPGLWNIGWGGDYVPDTGEGRWRRSIYTFWRRTVPPPNMILFDAARREVCVADRAATNTPLQALVTLNDPQYFEAAAALSAKSLAESPAAASAASLVTFVFRSIASREPASTEVDALVQLFESQRGRFAADGPALDALLKGDGVHAPAGADRASFAALALVASTVYSSDAGMMRR